MSKHIAEQTIKQLIKASRLIKGADVLMLGVTFKENCPDMRNTKVVDIIEELRDYEVNVDVYDPWVDRSEKSKWYTHGLISDPIESSKTYDAIVVSVGHKQFLNYTMADYEKLSKGTPVIMDVKNIVPNPTWRL
jgi:UDP-N-acetyl-D-galactosamine dehydrogenase